MSTIHMPSRRNGNSLALTLQLAPEGRTPAEARKWAIPPIEGGDGSTPCELVQQGRAGELIHANDSRLAAVYARNPAPKGIPSVVWIAALGMAHHRAEHAGYPQPTDVEAAQAAMRALEMAGYDVLRKA